MDNKQLLKIILEMKELLNKMEKIISKKKITENRGGKIKVI